MKSCKRFAVARRVRGLSSASRRCCVPHISELKADSTALLLFCPERLLSRPTDSTAWHQGNKGFRYSARGRGRRTRSHQLTKDVHPTSPPSPRSISEPKTRQAASSAVLPSIRS